MPLDLPGVDPRTLRAESAVASVSAVLDYHLSRLKGETKRNVTSLYRLVRAEFGEQSVELFTRVAARDFIDANYRGRHGAARSLIRNLTAAFRLAADSVSGMRLPVNHENPTSGIKKHIPWLDQSKPGSHAVVWERAEWDQIAAAIKWGY